MLVRVVHGVVTILTCEYPSVGNSLSMDLTLLDSAFVVFRSSLTRYLIGKTKHPRHRTIPEAARHDTAGSGQSPCGIQQLVAGHRRRVGWLVGAFVGWALGEGTGGLPCLILGAQMHFQVRVSPQKHEAIFLTGGLRQRLGGVSGPLGAQNQRPPSDFKASFATHKQFNGN